MTDDHAARIRTEAARHYRELMLIADEIDGAGVASSQCGGHEPGHFGGTEFCTACCDNPDCPIHGGDDS